MDNSTQIILVAGVVGIVVWLTLSTVSLRRETSKHHKREEQLHATGYRIWAHLTSAQQEELSKVSTLIEQEEWVERNIDPSLLNGVSPEKLLVFYANEGILLLGKGTFRRHMSPLGDIMQATPKREAIIEEPSDSTDEDDTNSVVKPSPDVAESALPQKTRKVSYRVKKSSKR